FMYFTDDFGEVTNLQLVVNGSTRSRNTYIPITYNFVQGTPYVGTPATPGLPPNTFDPTPVTNQYAAYQAVFSAATQVPTDVAGGNVTNVGGRIELTADTTLNLNRARIAPLNYLLLKCTNHFLGSPGAQISFPTADFHLGTTNGVLAISNLCAPVLNHPEGTIE